MKSLISPEKVIETISKFNDFKTLDSNYEKLGVIILFLTAIFISTPFIKKVISITTMDEFERLITERKEKNFISILFFLKDPILMLIFYIFYAAVLSFTLEVSGLGNNEVVNIVGILIFLLFVFSFFILALFFFLRVIFSNSSAYWFIFERKFKNKLKDHTVNTIVFLINSISGLFVYSILVSYLFKSNESQPIFEFLLAIFFPILLYFFYKYGVNINNQNKRSEYLFKVIKNRESPEELIFLYNIDSNRAVLKPKDNIDEIDIKIVYNFETDVYYEYKKINQEQEHK
jgi:hypothetical protein